MCLCGRKGRIARKVSEAPGSEVPSHACSEPARVPGRRRRATGGRCPVLGQPGRGCARGGRASARWAVGDPIVGRRLPRVGAPLWAGASPEQGSRCHCRDAMTLGQNSSSHCGKWETPGHPLESGSRVEVGVPRAEEKEDPSLGRQVHFLWEEEPRGQRCGKMLCDLPTLRGNRGQSWRVGAYRRAGRP